MESRPLCTCHAQGNAVGLLPQLVETSRNNWCPRMRVICWTAGQLEMWPPIGYHCLQRYLGTTTEMEVQVSIKDTLLLTSPTNCRTSCIFGPCPWPSCRTEHRPAGWNHEFGRDWIDASLPGWGNLHEFPGCCGWCQREGHDGPWRYSAEMI